MHCAWAALSLWTAVLVPCAMAAIAVPDASERAYLIRQYVFVDSPTIDGYLRDVASKLLAARGQGDRLPDILVYSSDEFMASTDASNNLLLSTRALRDLESEDELAALMAHELSHLVLGHNQRKSAMRNFPVGVETAGWIAAAADQMQHGGVARHNADASADFSDAALSKSQFASLIWSDVLMPGWSRTQERQADRSGYDMMRAAGYDTAAFGTLFSRLQAAQVRRSERMKQLQQVAERKLEERTRHRDASGPVEEVAGKFKDSAEHLAVEAVFERITGFGKDYDPPERRQQLLAEHANEQDGGRDKRPRSPRFRAMLRAGSGGAVLAADRAAIRVLAALNAGRRADAAKAIAPILLAAPGGVPLSPHLNFALGAWYQASGNVGAAELRALAWLNARLPPAQAYLWRATYPWKRKEYSKVIASLESGRKRLGSGTPFLPLLVTTARTKGDESRAEQYTRECAQEDRRNPASMLSVITFRGGVAPSGIYADCVSRLGREPAPAGAQDKTLQMLRKPIETGKSLAQKLRARFRRHDP